MVKRKKATLTTIFALLIAAAMVFTLSADPAWAAGGEKDSENRVDKVKFLKENKEDDSDEQEEGEGVHADPETFKKNFYLTVDQKEYTITEMEEALKYLKINDNMSDLEKYYILGKWANQRVVYDDVFWDGRYYMEYYRHQWDAYGAINEDELSVCAGIAIFYSNLCHAAGLPCKFVRLDPKYLDHTITYIPDINGHAYYADITENDFLMSKKACSFAALSDLPFSGIENENADDGTFEYLDDENDDGSWNDEIESYRGADIKECWQNKVSYKNWFKEYALHEGTDKNFKTDYVEAGSGEPGRYARYESFETYPAQPYYTSEGDQLVEIERNHTGIWFLDDFYLDPQDAENMILNKEMNEQFLNISGVKANYDCASTDELVNAVSRDINIRYFPSAEEGEVVPKATPLTEGDEYIIEYDRHDDETGEEVLLIQGDDPYSEASELRVRMNSASVKTAPTRLKGLVYNGSPQPLIEPGEGENGTMLYAVCPMGQTPADTDYSEDVPTETDAGKYDVWYKVVTTEAGRSDLPPQKMDMELIIRGKPINDDENPVVKLSPEVFTYNGKNQKPKVVAPTLTEGKDYKVEWDDSPSINVGDYCVTIKGLGNYAGEYGGMYEIKKAPNPMKLKAKSPKIKHSKVKKKAQNIKRTKALKVTRAQGKLTYKLVSAKKGSKSFKKKFKINKTTGKITVKKNTKKGTYKVKIKVKAAGNENYKSSGWKKVTVKIRVK